jgi:hypothetical protein
MKSYNEDSEFRDEQPEKEEPETVLNDTVLKQGLGRSNNSEVTGSPSRIMNDIVDISDYF